MYFNYFIEVLKKFKDFKGRASRSEYWSFTLIGLAIQIVLMFIGKLIDFPYLSSIFSVFIILPNIAVSVRRLHDVGKSGWMLLINLIPIIGFIWLLVLMLRKSDAGDNKYGPNPNNHSVSKEDMNEKDKEVSTQPIPQTFVTQNSNSVSNNEIEQNTNQTN